MNEVIYEMKQPMTDSDINQRLARHFANSTQGLPVRIPMNPLRLLKTHQWTVCGDQHAFSTQVAHAVWLVSSFV